MAGAGRKNKKDAKYAPREARQQLDPVDTELPNNLDGPKDPQATIAGSPFGPSLGYDPVRTQNVPIKEVPRLLELPAEAYKSNYDFPSDLPLRPAQMNTSGKAIQVRVNQFKVTQWPQKTVHQYDVTIGNGDAKRGLMRAVWNSKTVQDALRSVDTKWLWDGNKIAWCASKAPRAELRLLVDLDAEKGKKPRIDQITGQPRDNKTRISVKHVGEINMAVIKGYLEKKMSFDNTVLQAINFLDHCMRQYPTETYTQIKRSFYARGAGGRYPLDDVIEAMKGVYTSIRLCSLVSSNGVGTGLAVNVDVANGTFWAAQPLHQAARNYCKERNRGNNYLNFRDLLYPVKDPNVRGGYTQSRDFKELRKLVKLQFSIKHRGKECEDKAYTIQGFEFDPKWGPQGGHAKNVTFDFKDKKNPGSPPKKISVYDYFVQTYNIRLEHWYLPLVKDSKGSHFPMEICNIRPNQRYAYKLGPDQTAKMIKFAVTRPKDRIGAIQHGVAMLKWSEDPYLNHYGVKIDTNLTVTNARLLQPPEILYAGSKINPGLSGKWDLRGKKFFTKNTKPLKSWGVCICDGSVDTPTMQNFLKVFIQTYKGHGGVVENDRPVIYAAGRNEDLSDAVTKTRELAGNQMSMEPQIILYILRDKNSFTYERLKKNMECRYGLVSQMMQSGHIMKAQPQYCSNVCMKLNAKLGGSTSRLYGKDLKTPKSFFDVPTMIIGADVSHPSPGSPQASMAALTMSMDRDASRYAAAVQTNGYRVEMITTANIKSMMMPLFKHWIATVGMGKGPQHIYYFRDGVSEGQYMHVLEQEVRDMKAAIKEVFGDVPIKFTVTVASKRHHLRILPKDNDGTAGDKNGNPYPGTLVERDITHPFEYDFYLNSHSAIQGTARPVHYHVIMDEANVPTNKFQAMIYEHCYQYMRSTTPVSLYPAVYYAHLASNRARAHEDVSASDGPRGGSKFVEKNAVNEVLHAHGIGSSLSGSRDRDTEAKPLLQLGAAAPEATKASIKASMWYI